MKADVFFILDSFDFSGQIEKLISNLTEASALVKKMDSEKFIRFSKTSDFYDNAIDKLYGTNAVPEAGALASLLYDGNMSKARTRNLDSSEVIKLVNNTTPVEDNRWLCIYGELPVTVEIKDSLRNANNENELVAYSKHIVINNNLTSVEYADAFEGIYRNLIFHPKYNDVSNIAGGCKNFINGIFEMFDTMNCYVPKDGDVKGDVDYIDRRIKFETCEEGGGKKKRNTEEKKLDFFFEIDGDTKKYNCEYHCKLHYFDGQHETGKRHAGNRMYFGFYKPTIGQNKFLIAHLGDHL
ncbi:hypothetical protein [Vibrio scophthalmi]|uniref:Uncharacterized protein n=1 Tax=Vibrio scophthalmi LMG 19158 TaxID=870967 RepID=F9RNP0_9VIBR|nr:hypothetical protein [Vibrio scophthalmi]EGU37065.1 hypothetical protein VIS19158_18141 [Vibrio scophthalmi LMG 19158]